MICHRCTLRLSLRSLIYPPPPPQSTRPISSTTVHRIPDSPPPATSTSAAQPFSTPFTPSPLKTPGVTPKVGEQPAAGLEATQAPKSSTRAGTPLRGLGYIKGQETPLAREDAEYPEWLWGLLEGRKTEEEVVGDAFAKSKKQRRLASKAARALHAQGVVPVVKIPLEEQSINLPAGMEEEMSVKAQEAREELTGAMRKTRRKRIKETNYLKGMR